MKNKNEPKLADKIAGIVIVLVLLIAIVTGYFRNEDIKENRMSTTGTIVNLSHIQKSNYSLEYKYYVEGKKYKGTVAVNYFDCTKENKCIGSDVDVFYSSKNHGNSQAYLKKYDRYRTQVYIP